MLRKFSLLVFILNCFILRGQNEQLIITPPSGQEERYFIFENPKGSVTVTGYDGDMIVVNASPRYPPEPQKKTPDGLRRIGQNAVDMRAEVNGRNVLLLSSSGGNTVDFDIKIPSWFSLKLKSLDNGNVSVLNVSGVIEVVNNNGNITLENITGAAVLSSIYGNISASFREVKPGTPMMFTTFEGDIMLALPPAVNANLKMKSDKGEIYSDFDIQPVKRQPVVRQAENTAVYSLEDWTTGSINKGNGDFVLKTYSGNITLKKR